MRDDRFEWDDEKARANLAKHQLNFHVAKLAFDDPGAVDEPDETMDYREDRYQLIGMALGRLVVVIYTQRNSRVRIISARKANQRDERDYARQNQAR